MYSGKRRQAARSLNYGDVLAEATAVADRLLARGADVHAVESAEYQTALRFLNQIDLGVHIPRWKPTSSVPLASL